MMKYLRAGLRVSTHLGAIMVMTTPALTADTREGWGLQFRQDTFDKAIFPVAMMSEEGNGFDKALIAFTCGNDGNVLAFFQPERFLMFTETTKAQFRSGDTTKEFVFSVGDVPHMGRRLIVDGAKSEELAQIFVAAAGGEVPYRTDKKQGVFTSIAAAESFKIVKDHCPK